jgi:RNA recognition motif-containing protein
MDTKLYVDNLTTWTTETDLRDLFAAYGPVGEVTIPTQGADARSRGFGFVTMATVEGARTAIAGLNGKAIGTCTITVDGAWPHEQGEAAMSCPQ